MLCHRCSSSAPQLPRPCGMKRNPQTAVLQRLAKFSWTGLLPEI